MIELIVTLAVIGFLAFLITTYIPMAPPFKMVIYAIVAICVILYLLRVFGIADLPLPRVR